MAESTTVGRDGDLAALRIDRTPPPPARRPGRAGRAALVALLLAGAAILVFGLTAGRATRVRVATAQLRGAPSAPGPVLTGAGYVVTGGRYLSLGVRVPSRIEAYLVEEGETVEPQQALVQLDGRSYEAALREAKANLERAKADLGLQQKKVQRARDLHQLEVLAQADLDVAENQVVVADALVTQLEAEVARREVDLQDTVVRAPSAGVVLEKLKEVGEVAVPGGFAGSGELIRMANLADLRAEVDVNEIDLARIAMQQPAQVAPDAYPDRRYAAHVVKLYPQINRQKGTLKVEVSIEQPDAALRPDMSVRVEFLDAHRGAATPPPSARVVAPRAALREDGGAAFAWIVDGGRAARRVVKIASAQSRSGDDVEVIAGLSGGEQLVLGDTGELHEGQRVEVVPERE